VKHSSDFPVTRPRASHAASYAAAAKRLHKIASEAQSSEARQELSGLALMYEALAAYANSSEGSDANLH